MTPASDIWWGNLLDTPLLGESDLAKQSGLVVPWWYDAPSKP